MQRNLGDNWGAETSPSGMDLVYAQSFDKAAPGIVDYANSIRTIGESLVNAIARAQTTLDMTDYQRQMLQVQLQRAQSGLPPLATTAASPMPTWLWPVLIVGAGAYLLKRR